MAPLSRLIGQNGETRRRRPSNSRQVALLLQSERTTARTIKMFGRQRVLFSVPLENSVRVEATRTEINMTWLFIPSKHVALLVT
jgi:hypothetical protein